MKKWIPSPNIKISNQFEDIINCDKSLIILAGPGAGKTEILAQKSSYLLTTGKCPWPKKILCLTFKNEASKNIKNRVFSRTKNTSRFSSYTFHGFANSILSRFKTVLPENIRPNDSFEIFFGKGKENESTKNKIHINLVIGYAIKILESNDDIRNMISDSYKYIFIDEFQDTTDEQYRLITTIFNRNINNIICVGDINQSIMIWAGADTNIFNKFSQDFNPETLLLTENHRSSDELKKSLNNFLPYIEKGTTPGKNEFSSDNLKILFFDNELSEADFLAEEISFHIENGGNASDYCILTKQFSDQYSSKITTKLALRNISTLQFNELQDALSEPIGRLFTCILYAYLDSTPKEWGNFTDIILEMNNIYDDDDDAEYNLVTSISDFISKSKKENDLSTIEDIIKLIKATFSHIGSKKIRSRWIQYQNISYLNKVWKTLELHLRNTYNSVSNKSFTPSVFSGEGSVHIMNIHKCKGLEYKHVILLGFEDQAFWSYDDKEFGERCVIYVALSRAKEKITVTFVNNRSTRKKNEQFSTIEKLTTVTNILTESCGFSLENKS